MTRRDFVFGATSATAASIVGCRTCSMAAFDENLSVFLSDVHVPAGTSHMHEMFGRIVDEILAMRPLPRRVVCFGDIACDCGLKEDYLETRPLFLRLADAGIELTFAMGNHDRRSTFSDVWPEQAKRTLLPGRIVTRTNLGFCDLLMLDGLQGTDDRALTDRGPVAGALDSAQQAWLADELKRLSRPTIVGSHYPIRELKIGETPLADVLAKNPFVKGYVHGHDHHWYEEWHPDAWSADCRSILRCCCLPSTGAWGDIGYALVRTMPDRAEIQLVIREFYYPVPRTPVPATWNLIVRDKNGRRVTFALAGNPCDR